MILMDIYGINHPEDKTKISTERMEHLDSIFKTNSLFIVGAFIGLSLVGPNQSDPGNEIVKQLLTYETFSFSFLICFAIITYLLKLVLGDLIVSNETFKTSF